jgi:hypothetical protein
LTRSREPSQQAIRTGRKRERMRPDDWVLHRRSRPQDPIYDFKTHFNEHYKAGNMHSPFEQKRVDRQGRSLYYKKIYEDTRAQNKMWSWLAPVGLIVFLFASGYVEMMFI